MSTSRNVAKDLAEKLRIAYDTEGFKVLWDQYQRELRRAEVYLGTIRGETTDQVAMELARWQGFLDGLRQWGRVIHELPEELDKGVIPWERNRR